MCRMIIKGEISKEEDLDEIIGGMIFALVRKIKGSFILINIDDEESNFIYDTLWIQSWQTAKALKKKIVERFENPVTETELQKIYLKYDNQKIDDSFKLSALKIDYKQVMIGHISVCYST